MLESLVKANCPQVDLSTAPQIELRVLTEQPLAAVPSRHGEIDSGFAQNLPQEQRPATEQAILAHRQCEEPSALAIPGTANDDPQQGHEIGLVSLSSGGDPCYIGPSSGYFFAKRIFSKAGRRRNQQKSVPSVPGSNLSAELLNTPATIPSRKENAIELSEIFPNNSSFVSIFAPTFPHGRY